MRVISEYIQTCSIEASPTSSILHRFCAARILTSTKLYRKLDLILDGVLHKLINRKSTESIEIFFKTKKNDDKKTIFNINVEEKVLTGPEGSRAPFAGRGRLGTFLAPFLDRFWHCFLTRAPRCAVSRRGSRCFEDRVVQLHLHTYTQHGSTHTPLFLLFLLFWKIR